MSCPVAATGRSTPTRVGKTKSLPDGCVDFIGPPPRAWGKPRGAGRNPPRVAVHPHARGENILISAQVASTSSVHPHARGENATFSRCSPTNRGPPPRAWGKRVVRWVIAIFSPVHPHARGENATAPRARVRRAGPPPRAWGKRNTFSPQFPTTSGPPPRAWGKQLFSSDCWRSSRSTPTRVGKTWGSSTECNVGTVHPHARGENDAVGACVVCDARSTPTRVGKTCQPVKLNSVKYGPPPRAWGKPGRHRARGRAVRSTPTRVGKTNKG